MAHPKHRPIGPTTNVSELHRQWLELVDIDGPFLAIPPLKRVWPNGIPDFRNIHPGRYDTFAAALKDFEAAWETFERNVDSEARIDAYRAACGSWVETVLRDVAGWAESLRWGTVSAIQAQSPNRSVTVTAQGALIGADGVGALVHVVEPTDSLRDTPSDVWAATPVDRMEALLRENDVEIGIVTDGRWWGLVCAREGKMAASGIVDALTWVEEPRTRDAFLTLVGRQHLIGGEPDERLPVLFEDSIAAAEEITEALGAQVRRAVELLIQSFSESAADAKRRGLPNPLPASTHHTYEAAVTVMMRTVFLLFAEERGLLPSGELFEQGYGIAGELARLVAREAEESEEALDSTSLTWHRLLATSKALHSGASFENLRMPAYGGSLFDQARFPFLTATNEQGTLTIAVSDRVLLHVLRAVQQAELKGQPARQISFRDIDVEQIGYIYEGLLGFTCTTVDETYLGIIGATGSEPEIPLAKLEELAKANLDRRELAAAIRGWVSSDQPSAAASSVAAITNAIGANPDPSSVSALTQAVGDDYVLRDRIMPWLGLVRHDLRDHPFVVATGGLLVKETPSRKNAGAHYTPKSLAEDVVLHALQPLCYSPGPHQTADDSDWKLKTSDELLSLKIADIACGSGAFLVAAANYLAKRVVEAWIIEQPANMHRRDLHPRAIRQVVANCLYGADINDMAIEMCKLSLWLVSLDRELPFSFVDDKIFLGNSLLGITTIDQLRKLHIDPVRVSMDKGSELFDVDPIHRVDEVIRKAVRLRRDLASPVDDADPSRSSATKRRQLQELHSVTASLRNLADGVIAAGLPLGGKRGNGLDEAYRNLREAVKMAHPGSRDGAADSTWLDKIIGHGLTPTVSTDYVRWQPLHWMLEAPDVMVERGGFDAIIGNPPFLGGKKLTGAMGVEMREWLVHQIASSATGNADLVAYFFLRAVQLLEPAGSFGLIGTNSVAQGDTRRVGLEQVVDAGITITRSIQSQAWPSESAKIEFAAVWGTLGQISADAPRVADGQRVGHISALLEEGEESALLPAALGENADVAFIGCMLSGKGFLLTSDEAGLWKSNEPALAQVVFPFLTGDDVSSRQDLSASRAVVDFNDMPEARAREFPTAFALVEQFVRPERAKVNRKSHRERWWQFGERRPGLRKAIDGLESVLVIARTSSNVMPVRVPTTSTYGDSLNVFATDSYADQAVLSSSLHQLWAINYGGTLETRVRYVPSDVFETFPRPKPSVQLARIGQILDEERREIMLRRDLGLTKLYNLVNAPAMAGSSDFDIDRMRAIHVELDEAVIDAYGWSEIPLDHGFHTYRQMERWSVSPAARVEILDRLLDENHRRAAAEVAAKPKAASKRSKSKAISEGLETLFS